jgi:hypothetical protein
MLLATLLSARGADAEANRWRNSFKNSWAVGDAFFVARLERSIR